MWRGWSPPPPPPPFLPIPSSPFHPFPRGARASRSAHRSAVPMSSSMCAGAGSSKLFVYCEVRVSLSSDCSAPMSVRVSITRQGCIPAARLPCDPRGNHGQPRILYAQLKPQGRLSCDFTLIVHCPERNLGCSLQSNYSFRSCTTVAPTMPEQLLRRSRG